MVSSHILPELADMCNRFGFIEAGRASSRRRLTQILRKVRPQVIIASRVAANRDAAAKISKRKERFSSTKLATAISSYAQGGVADYSDCPRH